MAAGQAQVPSTTLVRRHSVDGPAEKAAAHNWFVELERGWSPWSPAGDPQFQVTTHRPYRYNFGKTEFEANFSSETEGTQVNLSTGKARRLQYIPRSQQQSLVQGEEHSTGSPRAGSKLGRSISIDTSASQQVPVSPRSANVIAEGESYWVIELEKGWSPWLPDDQPFQGSTDQPLRYKMGRYEFEVHFQSDTHGTQTNLATGKVRRVQRLQKGEPLPAWEGTGVRRRSVSGAALPESPAGSAAHAAQAGRTVRRSIGGYPGGSTTLPADANNVKKSSGPALRNGSPRSSVTQAASPRTVRGMRASPVSKVERQSSSGRMPDSSALPRFMRPTLAFAPKVR